MDEQQHDHDEAERAKRSNETAAAARIQHQTQWVEQQIRIAQERGDFDDLPGAGKPIEGLGGEHDPDWWLKKLVEREHISVLPPALSLRKEDADLEARLDSITVESEVRREVEDFKCAHPQGALHQLRRAATHHHAARRRRDRRGVARSPYGEDRGPAGGARDRACTTPAPRALPTPFLIKVGDDEGRAALLR